MPEKLLPEEPLVVLTGPTGSGKSALALRIAETIDAEIINADSVQLYRGFRIGAGQPSEADKLVRPHHLYEVLDPSVRSDVAEFTRLADKEIARLRDAGKAILVVGGTGLYIRALLHGLVAVPEISEAKILAVREELARARADADSQEQYFTWVGEFLRGEDVEAEKKLHPSDTQRIIRAVAVKRSTGQSLFSFQQEHAHAKKRHSALVLYLEPERELLYASIDARVEAMWEMGLCEEVESLLAQYGSSAHPMSSIGYRHVLQYLNGDWSREETIALMKRDTRRFAKRQMTWWRNQPARLGWETSDFRETDFSLELIGSKYKELAAGGESGHSGIRFLSFRSIK